MMKFPLAVSIFTFILENALKREPGSGAMQFTKVCIPY
jgi:hypothetical protein